MNDKKEFAFPSDANENIKEGLTKREYFAAKAMQGLLASFTEKSAIGGWQTELDEVARTSVDLADELLKALDKK